MSIQRTTPLILSGGLALAGLGTPNFWPTTCEAIKVNKTSKSLNEHLLGPASEPDAELGDRPGQVRVSEGKYLNLTSNSSRGKPIVIRRPKFQCLVTTVANR